MLSEKEVERQILLFKESIYQLKQNLMEETGSMNFLDYLSFVVRSGGFPGLVNNSSDDYPLDEIKKGVHEHKTS